MIRRSRSLVHRLTLQVSLAALASVVLVSYVSYRAATEQMQKTAARDLERIATVAAGDIDRWILSMDVVVGSAANIPRYLVGDDAERRHLEPLLRHSMNAIIRSSPVFIVGVAIIDAQQRVVVSTSSRVDPLLQANGEMSARLAGGAPQVGRVRYVPELGTDVFSLFHPVAYDNRLVGAVVVTFRRTELDRLLNRAIFSVQVQLPREVELVDERNGVIAHLAFDGRGGVENRRCGQRQKDAGAVCAAGSGQVDSGPFIEATASTSFASSRVHFYQSRDAVVRSFRHELLPWLIAASLLVAVFTFLTYLAVTRTIRPLHQLTRRVQRILGDASQEVSAPRGQDEVMALDRAFDDLHRRLEAMLRSLTLARDQAEAANRIKGQFLAHMSHEIRTPLTAIIGCTDLMLAEPDHAGAPDQETLLVVARNGRHLLALVNDFLDFSKIEAGELLLYPDYCDPVALAREVVTSLSAKAKAKGLELTLSTAGDSWRPIQIYADPLRCKQILLNLIDNGIKYTGKGFVAVEVAFSPKCERRGVVRWTIRDSGVGIAAADQAELFRPFTQITRGKRPATGTGLGLTISQRLARLMDGEIRCRSEPGKGSDFICDMQVEYRDVSHLPDLREDASGSDGAPPRAVDAAPRSQAMAAALPRSRIPSPPSSPAS